MMSLHKKNSDSVHPRLPPPMSDPRFARLKTDPRFRKPRRKSHKIVLDDRFKSVFDDENTKKGKAKGELEHLRISDQFLNLFFIGVTVDKYGRKISSAHKTDNLKRFYRLEQEEEATPNETAVPDFARGEFLMESSDEEDEEVQNSNDNESEVILGRDIQKHIKIPADEPEVDLDESQFAELDALAETNATTTNDNDVSSTSRSGEQTNRLAVVNLDWDHVRASHLFGIFSSVVSPSLAAPREREKGVAKVSQGRVLKVQIYPSEFGKVRLEQERKEGPPKELFKKHDPYNDGDDESYLMKEDDDNEYDEEALRVYQLERLRCVFVPHQRKGSSWHIDTIMPLSLAIPLRPPFAYTQNWMERNLSDQRTSLTLASYRGTWLLMVKPCKKFP